MERDFRMAKILSGIIIIAICLALAIGILGGCAKVHPKGSGVIMTKIREEGTNGYPPVFMIWVQEYETGQYGEEVIKSYEVTEETFNRYNVGDQYEPDERI